MTTEITQRRHQLGGKLSFGGELTNPMAKRALQMILGVIMKRTLEKPQIEEKNQAAFNKYGQ
jgi:hypothetical protein